LGNDAYIKPIFVEINDLAKSDEDGRLAVEMPEVLVCPRLVYSLKNIDYNSDKDYTWYGAVESENEGGCYEGELSLMSKDGEKFGTLSVAESFFRIYDLGDDLQVMTQVKDDLKTDNGSNDPQNYMIKKIYPNPTATDDVTVVVEMEQTENVQLYITDINGNYKKMVTDQEMTTGKNTFTFKVTDLVAGSYHLNLRTENKEEYHLLIIKK
jgi:hypothetical protein